MELFGHALSALLATQIMARKPGRKHREPGTGIGRSSTYCRFSFLEFFICICSLTWLETGDRTAAGGLFITCCLFQIFGNYPGPDNGRLMPGPNFTITRVTIALTFYLAWKRGFSPFEMLSTGVDDSLFERFECVSEIRIEWSNRITKLITNGLTRIKSRPKWAKRTPVLGEFKFLSKWQ